MRAFNVARPRQRNSLSNNVTNNMQFACIQTGKQTSFEKLFHLDYFTSVRTANSPRLLYLAASWLVARWFLGGELVGGETPYWRDDGKVQNMDPWSMDPLCGPGPWTGFIKIWTGSMDPLIMDRVHGPPIFTILYRYSLNSLEC